MTTTSDRTLPAPGDPAQHTGGVPTITDGPDAAVSAAPGPAPAPVPGAAMARLIRRVHFYAGILVAPFLAVLCLTGIAYVFTPQLNDALHAEQLLVTPQPGPALPLDDQVAAARATRPDLPLASVEPAVEPDRATLVVLIPPGAEEGFGGPSEGVGVYVNPYTAGVTGTLALTHGEPPVQSWLRGFHGDLQLGTVGAVYSEFAASWLPVLFLGGIVLWIGKRRARRRDLIIPNPSTRPGRAQMMNWHGSVGSWLTVALVFISLTGLTWSTYAGEKFVTVLTALDARAPKVTATVPEATPGATPISVGRAEAIGRDAGLQGPLTLTLPGKPGKPFLVAETSDSVPLHRDKIALDPSTGEVLQTLRFGEGPFLAQLSTIGILAHTGTLFGLANQIAMTAMALGILAVIFWGYRMWWLRRPTGRRAPRPLERRGVLRGTPQPVLFGIVLAAVGLGWLLPVFGISLALFLLADTLAGAVARRRAAT